MDITTIIALSTFGVAVLSAVGYYFYSNNKKNKQKPFEIPTVEPKEPEKPVEEPIEEPKQPEETIEEPVKVDTEPETPVEPEVQEEPEPVECTEEEEKQALIDYTKDLVDYFSDLIKIGPKTLDYIISMKRPVLSENPFPIVIDYYGEKENEYVGLQYFAWLFGMVLAELDPEKRNEIYARAYNYKVKGADQPVYGWRMDQDPNIVRMLAAATYATNRDTTKIEELRKEVGGKKISYKEEIDECYVNTTSFMPHAAGPYTSNARPYPVGDANPDHNFKEDQMIHNYVSQYYSLDTKDAEKRQATIQAIADKEGEVQHLVGKPRTVVDPKYGEMTFNPVFGKHNIGIEIPDDGAIAKLIDTVTHPCSSARKTLLSQEYGRRRPGMGLYDNTQNSDPKQRVLVNYAIEEGDGMTTGYYNKDGDYISQDGTHIGDYEDYFHKFIFANSYPSGHSAMGMGAGLILMEIMPDRADKILKAANQFAINRTIARYHWNSDTIQGRVIATTMIPVLHSVTNIKLDKLIEAAKKEYEQLTK